MFDQPSKIPLSIPSDAVEAENILFFTEPAAVSSAGEWGAGAHEEGQIAVDIIETAAELWVVAPIAGTRPEDLEVHFHNDVITIRGRRQAPVSDTADSIVQECYWGTFSRTIVLPVDVQEELAESQYRYGLLTIRLPKVQVRNSIPILVVEE